MTTETKPVSEAAKQLAKLLIMTYQIPEKEKTADTIAWVILNSNYSDNLAAVAREQSLEEAMSFYPYGAAQAALKSKPSEHDMPRKKINPNEVPTLLCDALDLLEQANKKTVNRFKSEHIVEAIRRVRLAIKMSVGAQ